MGIGKKDIKLIADMLSQKTGYTWTGTEEGVYCNAILNAPDRFEGERIFLNILKENNIRQPDAVYSSLRGMEAMKAQVSATFTLNSTLLSLLQNTDAASLVRARLEKENAQIASMLSKKTEFNWISNVDGVSCYAILNAPDRFEGERIFLDILKKNDIRQPDAVSSSLRGMENGKAQISVAFTTALALKALLKENKSSNTKETNSSSRLNISMEVLGGFMAVVGSAAVAAAFILLNATTFVTAGMIVAGLGVAVALGGVGLFAASTYKNRQTFPDEPLDFSSDIAYQ